MAPTSLAESEYRAREKVGWGLWEGVAEVWLVESLSLYVTVECLYLTLACKGFTIAVAMQDHDREPDNTMRGLGQHVCKGPMSLRPAPNGLQRLQAVLRIERLQLGTTFLAFSWRFKWNSLWQPKIRTMHPINRHHPGKELFDLFQQNWTAAWIFT